MITAGNEKKSPGARALAKAFLFALLLLFSLPKAVAKERVEKRFDETSGLTVSTVYALTQDDSGFLWIGTTGGLVRFDGSEMRPWAKDSLSRLINLLLSGPGGEVLILDEEQALSQVVADDIRPLAGPDGKPLDRVISASFSEDRSRLWVARAGSLLYRDADHKWGYASADALAGEQILRLKPAANGGVYLLTNKGIWKTDQGKSADKILDIVIAFDIVPHPDGSLYVLNWNLNGNGEVFELRDGRAELRLSIPLARPMDIAARGRVIWASFDRFFAALRPGQYAIEIRASLDGVRWSQAPARFSFEVLSPWYTRWWVLTLFALLLAGALYAAYRIRLAFLLRLERQRTRIAMDLHDELGSGLGSIGILSNIVTDEGLDETERMGLAKKIAETSRELGSALTDIVWALGPGSNNLESLAYHLTEHAERLFPGNQTIFSTDFPDIWPKVSLSLAARRNLQLIALEALHNAARHAGAGRVVLGLKPAGRNWQMWIEDDGTGLNEKAASERRKGMGLDSMKRRAEEIGADIYWTGEDGRGTTVTVRFHPQ